MKNILLILSTALLISCGGKAEAKEKPDGHDHSVKEMNTEKASSFHIHEIGSVMEGYFELTDAMAKDDINGAIAGLTKYESAIKGISIKGAVAIVSQLGITIKKLKESKSLDELRAHFNALTYSTSLLLENNQMKLPEVTYFKCPMVPDSAQSQSVKSTGFWISKDGKKANPYMGKSMPTCGSKADTILE